MLFQLWSGQVHRPTRDLDLLGQGDPAPERFQAVIRDICEQDVENDGLLFHPDSILVEQMKEDEEYQGVRAKLQATLASARIPIQIDIGFGDAINPEPSEVTYPTLLDLPAPTLKAYPRETVIAEKFQAMVMLGIANSRMKDFYDIWTLTRLFEFSGPVLCSAIHATFERRQTVLPQQPPLALTSEFAEDRQKQIQWRAFLGKGKLAVGVTLDNVAGVLRDFLMLPTMSIHQVVDFNYRWSPGGPWLNE